MTRLPLVLAITAISGWAYAEMPGSAPSRAPVLRNPDPADNRIVLLPGPAVHDPISAPLPTEPIPPKLEPPTPAVSRQARPMTAPSPIKPNKDAVKPPYPAEFGRDSAAFLQRRIGQWTERDCRALLGRPTASRPAFGEKGANTGDIYSFRDVTGRYARLELEFQRATGRLHTVFAYPRGMSWDDCRRLWGAGAIAATAKKGRMFYSYPDRRVDLLVEPSGKVFSIGLY